MAIRAMLALLMLLAWSPAALAQVSGWRVTEAAGQVEVRRGAQAMPARRGSALAPGDLVATGPNGRAVLVRNRDFVVVAPRSQVRVPGNAAEQGEGGMIRMFQVAGSAQYRIERQARPHFAVRAPQLVALVKGTVFTVTVSDEGATVAVTEGRVEVASLSGLAREMVDPGFSAGISAQDLERVVHGRSDSVAIGRPVDVGLPNAAAEAGEENADSQARPTLSYLDVSGGPAAAVPAQDEAARLDRIRNQVAVAAQPAPAPPPGPGRGRGHGHGHDHDHGHDHGDDDHGGDDRKGPSAGATPATPETPAIPEPPETPAIPAAPEIPATPAAPATPAVPATPAAPATPAIPATPAVPATPATPATPAVPATPATPATPAVPATPATPATPAVPAKPATPATPAVPATPATPATPAVPATPAAPPPPPPAGTTTPSTCLLGLVCI